MIMLLHYSLFCVHTSLHALQYHVYTSSWEAPRQGCSLEKLNVSVECRCSGFPS